MIYAWNSPKQTKEQIDNLDTITSLFDMTPIITQKEFDSLCNTVKFKFPDLQQSIPQVKLGLCGEFGEVANLFANTYRTQKSVPVDLLVEELGDLLFYIVAVVYTAQQEGRPPQLNLIQPQNTVDIPYHLLVKYLGNFVTTTVNDHRVEIAEKLFGEFQYFVHCCGLTIDVVLYFLIRKIEVSETYDFVF